MRKRKNRLLAFALAAAMGFSLAAPALPARAEEAATFVAASCVDAGGAELQASDAIQDAASVTSPSCTVSCRTVGEPDGVIYVSPNGKAENDGTSYDKAIDLATALEYAAPGQTILLQPGTYALDSEMLTGRDSGGTADKPITLQTDMSEAVNPDGSYAVLDFDSTDTSLTIGGDYWQFKYIAMRMAPRTVRGLVAGIFSDR